MDYLVASFALVAIIGILLYPVLFWPGHLSLFDSIIASWNDAKEPILDLFGRSELDSRGAVILTMSLIIISVYEILNWIFIRTRLNRLNW
jgi:hypothetical protein